MSLAAVVQTGFNALVARHEGHLPSHQLRALNAIRHCRSPALGTHHWRCPNCQQPRQTPMACGHRACPACQNHTTSQWIDRQRRKLLPVPYFMATFTVPAELRPLALARPVTVYGALFKAAVQTLQAFARNNRDLEIGLCAVLHTHSRRLDFHPHIHVVVPGGGLMPRRRQFKTLDGTYLFNARAMASVFRAKIIHALTRSGLHLPDRMPKRWVVDCRHVGRGASALEYLSRYLYRGVIFDRQIVRHDANAVTFRYRDAKTGRTAQRTLPLLDFLDKLLSHVLPTGFHRVREYGFLHGNAKRLLARIQLALAVILKTVPPRPRPAVPCPACNTPMIRITTCGPRWHAT